MSKMLFTSESVTEGHPDKVCDAISDAVLDAVLCQDKNARVACETFCSTDSVNMMGEITTTANVDYEKIAREVIAHIGYTVSGVGFDAKTCKINVAMKKQSPDIAMGVDKSLELKSGEDDELNLHGAGDQGMMFGFACDETEELMPLAISLAHKMSKKLTAVRKSGELGYLLPDGKTQVTVEYENGTPKRIDAVVVSSQHTAETDLEILKKDIFEKVIKVSVPANLMDENTKIFINPTGRFVVGGPAGDTGLTGRKIIVDTYGGYARHGGGAFSGKDPTKVDRSAAYAARYVAKNIVAAKIAKRCEIQLAYAIGVASPVSVMVDTFGTGVVSDEKIAEAVKNVFDLRPEAIIRKLDLRRPIYRQTSSYGHMGRTDIDVNWEKTDMVNELINAIR